ncbi:hypothetical protein LguiA_024765 [Lonicera macranthoides]
MFCGVLGRQLQRHNPFVGTQSSVYPSHTQPPHFVVGSSPKPRQAHIHPHPCFETTST